MRRSEWLNLNGEGDFSLDSPVYDKKINVPYPWGSPLSGIEDDKDGTGYYRRVVRWSPKGGHVFLIFGAVDYDCVVRVNGKELGSAAATRVSSSTLPTSGTAPATTRSRSRRPISPRDRRPTVSRDTATRAASGRLYGSRRDPRLGSTPSSLKRVLTVKSRSRRSLPGNVTDASSTPTSAG